MKRKKICSSVFLFFIIPLILSCKSTKNTYKLEKNQPIVDYNKSYDYYDKSIGLNKAIQKYNEQTVILYNEKQISKEEFNKLVEKKKIKSIETIKDSAKISSLGFTFNNVKRIISTKNEITSQ